jgi:hypothetical protein
MIVTIRLSAVPACALVGLLSIPCAALAAQDGELWEVTTQMNVPGMPAGMGGMTTQVCRDKDPRKEVARGKDTKDCKVTDLKQSGNRVTMTMSCPQGKSVMDMTYNSAHTEYKGSVRMTGRDGEMTMNMSGRKLGNCDLAQAKSERDARVAQAKAGSERAQAAMKANEDTAIQGCNEAVETMRAEKLGVYTMCSDHPEACESMAKSQPRAAAVCKPKRAEFCRRYQTQEGFLKAKGDEQGAKICGTSTQKVKASLCPQAAKSESLNFLGQFCPAEAKPIAQAHCAGRGYTSKVKDQYTTFCQTYLANADFDERERINGTGGAGAPAGGSVQKQATDAATGEAINQGINKLKGLFSR